MIPTASRGRLIFIITVALLIMERLALAGLALSNYSQQHFNWTSVLLPITHIAVVLFLVYTSDMLIYWLVIMWGIITTGHFGWLLWVQWRALLAHDKTVELSKVLISNWPVVLLVFFHLFLTLAFLLPSVRAWLSAQRSKLDFEGLASELPAADLEAKKR